MKILFVAGGTGGHLYPAIAVARLLRDQEVRFVVRRGDLGRDILAQEGFTVEEIIAQGIPRRLSFQILSYPIRFIQGWVQARRLLKRDRPDWVLAMGGYLSVPVIMNARLLGIRTLLHEQNVLPGLANRLLSRWADSVAISFPASQSYLKGENVWVSGLPIRPEIGRVSHVDGLAKFGLNPKLPVFFVFGGSLGARRLNSMALETWPILLKAGRSFQVLHVTGTQDFSRIEKLYRTLQLEAKVLPYCHEIAHAYAASSVIVCRSGASTIAELLANPRPALLVPYPYASNNHQVKNAEVLQSAGWGRVILDGDLTPQSIAEFLQRPLVSKIKSDLNPRPGQAAAKLADYLTSHPS